MTFSTAQVEQLLQPINGTRVLQDGKGHSHVSQQDILAHLIRVFGFGGFDIEVLAADCVFEAQRAGSDGKPNNRYDVCYRALVALTIRDEHGVMVTRLENGSTATAQNQTRGDAHDLAYKSAISLSVKRAAIALGDQFGLSLYNKGQRNALVRGTLVGRSQSHDGADVQEGVEQQVALGHDEVDVPLDRNEPETQQAPATDTGEVLTDETKKRLYALFAANLITDPAKQLDVVSRVLGRQVTDLEAITETEGQAVVASGQRGSA